MTRTTLRPASRPRWRTVLAAASAATLLAACGGGGNDDETRRPTAAAAGVRVEGAVQDVTFLNILPLESLTFTPELVASSCGYFEDHGLNVTFETTQGSAQAIQTVIAGGALITRVGDMETMVATGEREAPLVNVGQINKTGTIRFVSDKSDPLRPPPTSRAGSWAPRPRAAPASSSSRSRPPRPASIPMTSRPRWSASRRASTTWSSRAGSAATSSRSTPRWPCRSSSPTRSSTHPRTTSRAVGRSTSPPRTRPTTPTKQKQLRSYLAAIKDAVQFVEEDEANGFAETIKCLADYDIPTLKDPEVGKAALTSTSSRGPRPATTRSPRPCPSSGQTVYKEMSGAGFVPEGLNPEDWYTNDFAPGS